MSITSPTYRYGIILNGASYAPGDPSVGSHVIMAETIADVERIMRNARANYAWRYDLTGDGARARHAHAWLFPEPTYRYTFGPRGGLTRESF